jgi:hypothetical protein
VLNIKNQDKLLGKAIYSKFLPQLGEWTVVSVLRDEHMFNINIQNTESRDMERIYLQRRPWYDPISFSPKYRLMGYCKITGKETTKLIGKHQIQDMNMLLIEMVMMLKKMRLTT